MLGIAGIVCAFIVFGAINSTYCAWQPDTVVGYVVKWVFWDARRC
jgi:hypothetical protein